MEPNKAMGKAGRLGTRGEGGWPRTRGRRPLSVGSQNTGRFLYRRGHPLWHDENHEIEGEDPCRMVRKAGDTATR